MRRGSIWQAANEAATGERPHRLGGHLLERVGQLGMVDGDARAPEQFLPEPLQHLGGRAHAALAHQAVELVGGRRDAVAEEQGPYNQGTPKPLS